MPNLSYKTIFQKYGIILTKFLKANIESGGDGWEQFNPKTTKGSVSQTLSKTKSGKNKITTKLLKDSKYSTSNEYGEGKDGGAHRRMILTGNTKNNAFKHKAEQYSLTLEVPTQKYIDIINGNNINGPARKRESSKPYRVAIFPVGSTELTFANVEPMMELKKDIQVFTEYYFQNLIDTDLNKTITIGQ